MLKIQNAFDRKSKRIAAGGVATGISLMGVLVGLSLVFFSLRNVRVRLDLKREE